MSILKKIIGIVFVVAVFFSWSQQTYAASTIILSSPSLSSDGKTITATISGGTGTGYAPANGVTGLVPQITTNGGAQYPIATSTISGSTLTIQLGSFIPQGETVTLDITSTSTITDSGSNSAQGQTGISVTNNSAKSVSRATATSSAVIYYGRITSNIGIGSAFTRLSSSGSEVVFVVNGTDATAFVYGTDVNAVFSVSVDGGSYTNITLPVYNTKVAIPLFSNLSAGDHTVALKRAYNGTYYLYIPNAFQTAGGTGVYRAASTTDGAGYGNYLIVGNSGFANTGNLDNLRAATAGPYSSPYIYSTSWINGQFRVRARTSTLRIWTFLNGTTLSYNVDGVRTGSTVLMPNTQNFGFVTVATGLDPTTEHLYTINDITGALYSDAVMLVGSDVAYSSTSVPTLVGISGFGDSITAGTGVTDYSLNWIYKTAKALNQTPYNRGISGSTVISSGQTRTVDVTGIAPVIPKNFILYGTNDISAAGGASATTPTSGFGTAYQSMLTSFLANSTSTVHYVMGILPRNGYATSTIAAWNGSGNGVQGSIAAVKAARPADAGRLIYIDTSTWKMNGVNETDYTTNYFDGLHPNDTGYSLMANNIIPYASSTGYSLSGPSSGTSSAASSNFTVTIASGATFTGNQSITISDGGNGGIITPSVGSATTSSVTVTPTASTTSFTFTYTPSSVGSKTLTLTNGQGWTDASSTMYNSVVAISAPTLAAPTATSISTSTVVMNSSITSEGNASSTVRGFNYGTTAAYGYATSTTGVFGLGVFTKSISGLLPSTLYHYQSYAINAGGTGTSIDQTFTTATLPTVSTAPQSQPGDSAIQTGSSGGSGRSHLSNQIILPVTIPIAVQPCSDGALFNVINGQRCDSTTSINFLPATVYTRNLTLGSTGEDVRALQQFLNSNGFEVSSIGAGSKDHETTLFGRLTKAALSKFQAAKGIVPSIGYFGPLTRAFVNK